MQVQLRVKVTKEMGLVTLLLLMKRINCTSKKISIRQDSDGLMVTSLAPTSIPWKKVHFLKFFNSTIFNYIICFSISSAFLLEASNICNIRCRLQLCYGENGFIFILLIFIYIKSLQQLYSLRMWHCYISLQLVKHGLNRSINPSSGKQVEILKRSKSVEILSSIAALGAKALASIQHQVILADQQCWISNLSFSCWMLVLVTFGLPQNVLFPKQKGHTMKGEVCITCFNAEALQDQRGPYLPFSTLPRLSRLNSTPCRCPSARPAAGQAPVPPPGDTTDTADSTAVQGEACPVHEFELGTCIRAGLLLKSQSVLWLTTMGKLQVFWETLNSSQIFLLLWRTGKIWLQN